MTFNLFDRAILRRDFPEAALERGDVGIVVKHVIREGGEDGYILEQPRANTMLTYRGMVPRSHIPEQTIRAA